ncbi:T9SS type A sorting domain-containing protein [candidate division KSB1 bacterium]|nr:T9SS type A sorting domain-containing protein [candidate division KSB1 bacterium]
MRFVTIGLLFVSGLSFAAGSEWARPDSIWESHYRQRLEKVITAHYPWSIDRSGDPDAGKRAWSPLLANMWHDRHSDDALNEWIEGRGFDLLKSNTAGSFYKPFSCPGYALYYFLFKDQLPSAHRDLVKTMLYDKGWSYLRRPDHHMDPIYRITEFNSENFNWMSRLTGFLFAHEYNDPDQIDFFETYVDNWTRAIFNAGRVEWDSNVYFAYCFQPALVLYECAPTPKSKRQAQAVLDWMCITAALHYMDGFQSGPDVRAKARAYRPFDGSAWFYTNLYFAEFGAYPSITEQEWIDQAKRHFVGFAAWSSYRPPLVAIDIAQRRFETPIEMHNAKPFYHLDQNNYADWKGDTPSSRRFEFETLYLEKNYTLGSLATFRPDGNAVMNTQNQKMFSEQNVWRLAVRQHTGGALQVFGNAGEDMDMAGRCALEQIAQYENVMIRVMKHQLKMWIALPQSATVIRKDSILFANLGHNVYLAVLAFNLPLIDSATFDATHDRYTWHDRRSGDDLRGMVLEAGTKENYGSLETFIQEIMLHRQLTQVGDDSIQYVFDNKKLEMRYMPPTVYTLVDGTVIDPAGVIPRVWRDGREVEFSLWESYEVVRGEPIVSQEWSGGELSAQVYGKGMTIRADDRSADIRWSPIGETGIQEIPLPIHKTEGPFPFPNPFDVSTVIPLHCKEPGEVKIDIWNTNGQLVRTLFHGYLSAGQHRYKWKGLDDCGHAVARGLYFCRVSTPDKAFTFKLAYLL